jgi:hypothetical protein
MGPFVFDPLYKYKTLILYNVTIIMVITIYITDIYVL